MSNGKKVDYNIINSVANEYFKDISNQNYYTQLFSLLYEAIDTGKNNGECFSEKVYPVFIAKFGITDGMDYSHYIDTIQHVLGRKSFNIDSDENDEVKRKLFDPTLGTSFTTYFTKILVLRVNPPDNNIIGINQRALSKYKKFVNEFRCEEKNHIRFEPTIDEIVNGIKESRETVIQIYETYSPYSTDYSTDDDEDGDAWYEKNGFGQPDSDAVERYEYIWTNFAVLTGEIIKSGKFAEELPATYSWFLINEIKSETMKSDMSERSCNIIFAPSDNGYMLSVLESYDSENHDVIVIYKTPYSASVISNNLTYMEDNHLLLKQETVSDYCNVALSSVSRHFKIFKTEIGKRLKESKIC